MKPKLSNYWKHTPKKWKKIGLYFTSLGTIIGTSSVAMGNPIAGYVVLLLSIMGLTFTQLFSDDDCEIPGGE